MWPMTCRPSFKNQNNSILTQRPTNFSWRPFHFPKFISKFILSIAKYAFYFFQLPEIAKLFKYNKNYCYTSKFFFYHFFIAVILHHCLLGYSFIFLSYVQICLPAKCIFIWWSFFFYFKWKINMHRALSLLFILWHCSQGCFYELIKKNVSAFIYVWSYTEKFANI